ncbi:pyridoxal phosphate-dependent aminotransferase [Fimbriimonas ginsengisoli]|nr:histidinol-phosphate transaminase [Fimbriimonas ginsengisoli]
MPALESAGEWMCRTSPPTHAEGLLDAISEARRIPVESILAGAGSSSLIFSALRSWLHRDSRVLLIEPTYGEYEHICGIVGCRVEKLLLREDQCFRLDLDEWSDRIRRERVDLAVLVNPNNPAGGFLARTDVERALDRIPPTTRVLIDEAYIDYAGGDSCEMLAAKSRNVFVVKSLSKGLALSGLRTAYMTGPSAGTNELAKWSPPWAVSLPAQIASTRALGEPDYYAGRYRETKALRQQLATALGPFGTVTESVANWVLLRLSADSKGAEAVVQRARQQGVHLRNAGRTAASMGDAYVRIAVKPLLEQERIVKALQNAEMPEP